MILQHLIEFLNYSKQKLKDKVMENTIQFKDLRQREYSSSILGMVIEN